VPPQTLPNPSAGPRIGGAKSTDGAAETSVSPHVLARQPPHGVLLRNIAESVFAVKITGRWVCRSNLPRLALGS
jgi:hypothetical protein